MCIEYFQVLKSFGGILTNLDAENIKKCMIAHKHQRFCVEKKYFTIMSKWYEVNSMLRDKNYAYFTKNWYI